MKIFISYLIIFLFTSNSLFSQTDSLRDARNNKTYKTVKIGEKTWMAENLNFKTDNSYCYKNKPNNCDEYGRLYQWEIATEVCPEGWRLPSDNEWKEMEITLGMSTEDSEKENTWRGTNQATQLLEGGNSGFEAKLGGYKNPPANFFLEGIHSFFWTSSATKSGYRVWYRQMIKGNPQILRHNQAKNWSMSVRCIKD